MARYVLVLRFPVSLKVLTAQVRTAPNVNVKFKITKEAGAPPSQPGLTQDEINAIVRFGQNWRPGLVGVPGQMMMSLIGWLSQASPDTKIDTQDRYAAVRYCAQPVNLRPRQLHTDLKTSSS